jgi:SAM-dependent methyltransferase
MTARIIAQLREAGRKLVGHRVASYARRVFRRRHPAAGFYCSVFAGKRGIEIGGPSEIFCDAGLLPVYKVLGDLDNCLYSARTIWTGDVPEGKSFQYHPRKPCGNQIFCEATELKPIKDSAYECLLASHCLEHVANPLRALREWKRVLRQDGVLLLILPHKDGTFDWKRPTTSLAHMIEDFRTGTGEDDLTHLPEILALHDLEKDKAAGSKEAFQQRCAQNYSKRAMHHHVFDTRTAVALLDHANFQVVRVDTANPYHIMILARPCDQMRDNSAFLGPDADYRRRSPFPSDRLK